MPKTILIVDDSRVSRMMIKALLHDLSPGWQVLEAADAEEALKLTDTHKRQ
jgi:CheY-like chemotaxis protein